MVSFGSLTCVPVSLGSFCFGHLCLVPLLASSSPVPLTFPFEFPFEFLNAMEICLLQIVINLNIYGDYDPKLIKAHILGIKQYNITCMVQISVRNGNCGKLSSQLLRSPLADKLKCWKRRGIFGALKDFAAVYEPVSTVEVCATLMKDWLGEKRWSMPW